MLTCGNASRRGLREESGGCHCPSVDDAEETTATLDFQAATGTWAVRSGSSTVYYVDCDSYRVLRARGLGSQRFPFDNTWVPLVDVVSRDAELQPVGSGRITVGERPEYVTAPRGLSGDYEWRIQRVVTEIERLPEDVALALSSGGHDSDASPRP